MNLFLQTYPSSGLSVLLNLTSTPQKTNTGLISNAKSFCDFSKERDKASFHFTLEKPNLRKSNINSKKVISYITKPFIFVKRGYYLEMLTRYTNQKLLHNFNLMFFGVLFFLMFFISKL